MLSEHTERTKRGIVVWDASLPVQKWTDYFHDYGIIKIYSSGSDIDISVIPDNPDYRVRGVRIYP